MTLKEMILTAILCVLVHYALGAIDGLIMDLLNLGNEETKNRGG